MGVGGGRQASREKGAREVYAARAVQPLPLQVGGRRTGKRENTHAHPACHSTMSPPQRPTPP